MSRIVLRNVNKKFKTLNALNNIDIQVNEGQVLGIIGKNGSGKSTLLRLMAGIIKPSRGRIKVDGRAAPFIELGVGFEPELNAIDNVYLYGALIGIKQRILKKYLRDIIQTAGLERFVNLKIKEFSDGMKLRLAFAISIFANPDILLFDEFLAVGDAEFKVKCLNKVKEYRCKGKSIVYVSHDLGSILELCDRCILLHNGIIIKQGKPKDVVEFYKRGVFDSKQENVNRYNEMMRVESQGIVSVTDVKFFDKNNKPSLIFNPGGSLTMSVDYVAHKKIEQPRFGFNLHSEDGSLIAGPNTSFDGYDIEFISGKGQLKYKITRLPLLGGKYYVSVCVANKNDTINYAFLDKAFSFEVREDKKQKYGLLKLDAKWKLLQ